ncbi:MAG: substrate-binding domain-containing protein [Gammaproteobacteria bacterium]
MVAVKQAHGTRTDLKRCSGGEADLAAASRPLTETEALGMADSGNLRSPGQEHVVAIDGLAIIVHPDKPLRQLDIAQITALFAGSVNNWARLGGPDRQVRIYARDDKSGTYDTFERLVLRGASLDKRALRFESMPAGAIGDG